ncbi:MAG: hypothetical protein HYZ81_10350 [Nitrospinae bacterium]|nr:hypothetical protein [Nitrospinota bacterium]
MLAVLTGCAAALTASHAATDCSVLRFTGVVMAPEALMELLGAEQALEGIVIVQLSLHNGGPEARVALVGPRYQASRR